MAISGVTIGLQNPNIAAAQPARQAAAKSPDLDGDNDGTTAASGGGDTDRDAKRLLDIKV